MTKPITPDEAMAAVPAIPGEVYDVFNRHIVMNMKRGSSTVKEKDVLWEIAKTLGVSESEVYDKQWLDVERSYEQAGWGVRYDKPGYNETYEATFTFTAKQGHVR